MDEMDKLKDAFTLVYEKNLWGDDLSVSGPGSNPDQTKVIRIRISDLIEKYKLKSIIDAPCGDFLWMKEIISRAEVDYYTGFDIVSELIENNKKKYQTDKIDFHISDLTRNTVPDGDLIICRDCFLHLSYRNIYYILRNFKQSGTKYLLVSSYTKHKNVNVIRYDLPGRAINIEKSPFKTGPVIEVINENYLGQNGEFSDKSLMFLEISSINIKKIYFRVLTNELFFIPRVFIIKFSKKVLRKSKKLFRRII